MTDDEKGPGPCHWKRTKVQQGRQERGRGRKEVNCPQKDPEKGSIGKTRGHQAKLPVTSADSFFYFLSLLVRCPVFLGTVCYLFREGKPHAED